MKLNNTSKTIYIFTDWYVPGFKAGGPIQSVYNLATLLSDHFNVKIVTRNTDYGSNVPYENIVPDQWTRCSDNHEVMYLSEGNINFRTIKEICKTAKNDIIFINGIFSIYFSVLPLFLAGYYNVQKTLVSTRGMLHKSALAVKPFKKQLFLAFARGFGLYKKATLLSTSAFENEEIIRSLGKVKTEFAPNIPIQPLSNEILLNKSFKDSNGNLRLLFLGRISPEKNPIAVLKALKEIEYSVSITFIGSSIDGGYQQLFENERGQLPPNITFEWIKELPHTQIQVRFNYTDIMVLPSHGENFGHAIFESFAHGTPVIIGNNTPWNNIESSKAGIEVEPDNIQELIKAINSFNNISTDEYKQWQNGALKVAGDYFASNNFEKIYLELLMG